MPCIRHSANKKHRHQHYRFDILPYTIEYSYHTVKRSDVYSAFTEWLFSNSELMTIGNKPMQIYPKVIQKILTFVIPLFVCFNFPVLFIVKQLSVRAIFYAFILNVLFLLLSNVIFKKGVKRYVGSGS